MNMNIKTMPVESLKALAYDCIASIEREQNNLSLINKEIAGRLQVIPRPEEGAVSHKKK